MRYSELRVCLKVDRFRASSIHCTRIDGGSLKDQIDPSTISICFFMAEGGGGVDEFLTVFLGQTMV